MLQNIFFGTYLGILIQVLIALVWGWGILYTFSKIRKYNSMLIGTIGCLGMMLFTLGDIIVQIPDSFCILLPKFPEALWIKTQIHEFWKYLNNNDFWLNYHLYYKRELLQALLQICLVSALASHFRYKTVKKEDGKQSQDAEKMADIIARQMHETEEENRLKDSGQEKSYQIQKEFHELKNKEWMEDSAIADSASELTSLDEHLNKDSLAKTNDTLTDMAVDERLQSAALKDQDISSVTMPEDEESVGFLRQETVKSESPKLEEGHKEFTLSSKEDKKAKPGKEDMFDEVSTSMDEKIEKAEKEEYVPIEDSSKGETSKKEDFKLELEEDEILERKQQPETEEQPETGKANKEEFKLDEEEDEILERKQQPETEEQPETEKAEKEDFKLELEEDEILKRKEQPETEEQPEMEKAEKENFKLEEEEDEILERKQQPATEEQPETEKAKKENFKLEEEEDEILERRSSHPYIKEKENVTKEEAEEKENLSTEAQEEHPEKPSLTKAMEELANEEEKKKKSIGETEEEEEYQGIDESAKKSKKAAKVTEEEEQETEEQEESEEEGDRPLALQFKSIKRKPITEEDIYGEKPSKKGKGKSKKGTKDEEEEGTLPTTKRPKKMTKKEEPEQEESESLLPSTKSKKGKQSKDDWEDLEGNEQEDARDQAMAPGKFLLKKLLPTDKKAKKVKKVDDEEE